MIKIRKPVTPTRTSPVWCITVGEAIRADLTIQRAPAPAPASAPADRTHVQLTPINTYHHRSAKTSPPNTRIAAASLSKSQPYTHHHPWVQTKPLPHPSKQKTPNPKSKRTQHFSKHQSYPTTYHCIQHHLHKTTFIGNSWISSKKNFPQHSKDKKHKVGRNSKFLTSHLHLIQVRPLKWAMEVLKRKMKIRKTGRRLHHRTWVFFLSLTTFLPLNFKAVPPPPPKTQIWKRSEDHKLKRWVSWEKETRKLAITIGNQQPQDVLIISHREHLENSKYVRNKDNKS